MSTTEDHKELEIYEIGYSILTSIPEEKLGEVVAKIKKTITDVEGTLLDGEDPYLERLAYSMSKTIGSRKYVAEEAYIGWQKFESIPENVPVIKNALDKIDELLRFLLIKTPRETTFTFEGARKAKAEKEVQETSPELEEGIVDDGTLEEVKTPEVEEVAEDESVVE